MDLRREVQETGGMLLLHESRRAVEVAPQVRLRLGGDPPGHDLDGNRDRQHRDQGAREEDSVPERREQRHQRTVKSRSTAASPAGTSTFRVSRTTPSVQTAMV